jgi:hypothetical protein
MEVLMMTTEISIDKPKETLALHPSAFDSRDGDPSACKDFYGEIASLLQVELVEVHVSCGQKWGATFRDSKGCQFGIRPDWQKGERLTVSGDWPRTKEGCQYAATTYQGESNPSINVRSSRKSGEIAREIKRRFLPDFRTRWQQVAHRVKEIDTYTDNRQANRKRIAALIEGADLDASGTGSELVWAPSPYNQIQVSGDSVRIELYSIPLGLAEQVIEVVEKHRKEHPNIRQKTGS